MSRIKEDLVCEIIRISQTNLLAKKKAECTEESGDETILEWIRCNAANYRRDYKECLDSYSSVELGDMLNMMTHSKKDLSDIFKKYPQY